ncbi:MAG: DinB family protein [Ignavibacteriae bacterium]|nr:DinB family protein [Ignavibacteriota bacterium]
MKKSVHPTIELLLQMVDEGYATKAWHGPNLRGSIRGLAANEAEWRPSSGRHNIWEIVVHAAYWKYAVRRRLRGDKRGSFPIKGSNWFRRPIAQTEEAWRQDVKLLEQEHNAMHEAIRELYPSEIFKTSKGSRYTNFTLIQGIAMHDVYHAGQIQLLKRLQQSGRRK